MREQLIVFEVAAMERRAAAFATQREAAGAHASLPCAAAAAASSPVSSSESSSLDSSLASPNSSCTPPPSDCTDRPMLDAESSPVAPLAAFSTFATGSCAAAKRSHDAAELDDLSRPKRLLSTDSLILQQ